VQMPRSSAAGVAPPPRPAPGMVSGDAWMGRLMTALADMAGATVSTLRKIRCATTGSMVGVCREACVKSD
jgi:hypothetical protein